MSFQLNQTILQSEIKIDRITICTNEPNHEFAQASIKHLMHTNFIEELSGIKVRPGSRYVIDVKLDFPLGLLSNHSPLKGKTSVAKAFFQAGPKAPGVPTYRLELNPSNFEPHDWIELEAFIASSTNFEWQTFVWKGKITRLDLAIDMPGRQLSELLFGSSRKQKHGVYGDRNSYPETQYFGASNRSRVVVYDKQKPPKKKPLLRLERRLYPAVFGADLIALKNPFCGIRAWHVSILDCLPPSPYKQQIEDSLRLRGINRGLSELPKPDRNILRKALKSQGSADAEFEALWEDWPKVLDQYNIVLLKPKYIHL
ncbi:hypothetical protein [Roseitalea porphyridii]|uniref:Replication initiation factor domain-containing protein n=1 Tax=Roseitalea porphyridii TaxID=1852022 RepID=A0A4P6UZC4_9HYPH|nr:hypothetical protein [Roseitalea porphyridii]QBK30145.1 hypothetical protein E0E05_05755 [Roseitalea porphyridii]